MHQGTLLQATETNQPWQRFVDWGNDFLYALPDIIAALVVCVVVFFLAGIIRKIDARTFYRRSDNPAIATVMDSFITSSLSSSGYLSHSASLAQTKL
jgi:hypothetical protein